jgi:hypothetical protein
LKKHFVVDEDAVQSMRSEKKLFPHREQGTTPFSAGLTRLLSE